MEQNTKTNGNDYASPISGSLIEKCGAFNESPFGLTKREYFAAMAMQGLLHNYNSNGMYGNSVDYPMVHKQAVECADCLIAELNVVKTS
jgi:hypothetical protein